MFVAYTRPKWAIHLGWKPLWTTLWKIPRWCPRIKVPGLMTLGMPIPHEAATATYQPDMGLPKLRGAISLKALKESAAPRFTSSGKLMFNTMSL